MEEIVQDIIKKAALRKNGATSSGHQNVKGTVSDALKKDALDYVSAVPDEDIEEDEYTKAPVDYTKRIEQAKQKSVGEIDRITRYEYLNRKAQKAEKYSYEWFCTLLDMEALASAENALNSKEISISFGKVELENGTSRTLILNQPSRYIPQYMEDLADIPLMLSINGKKKTVAIEVANVQSYSLRVKLRINADIDGVNLEEIDEARIDAHNPVFLVEALRKQFLDLNFNPNFNLKTNLCRNIEFVFGPPGTGKTTSLANNTILPLCNSSPSVRILVLAPTNKAADVLTKRIVECNNSDECIPSWLIRFGITSDYDLEAQGIYKDKTFDIRSLNRSVTITTISRFAYDFYMPQGERLYLRDLNWDYIIIDEASMIPIANIMFPLYKKNPTKFIIAGDPFQIEPISAVDMWKSENIYTLVNLDSFVEPKTSPIQYPVTLLTTQYRSIPAVGDVFSNFLYGGILKHYRQDASQRKLNIDPYIDINTLNIIKFPVSKYESIYRAKTLQHKSPYHIYSALFTFEFASYLAKIISSSNPTETFSIGIIAPYRAQSDLIMRLLASEVLPNRIKVSVGTIHSFQGDESDIVITVFNPPPTISASKNMFLNKSNIVNVAITRARDYLFVIMPDDDTENVLNLKLVKEVERIMQSGNQCTVFDSHFIEGTMFGSETYLDDNSFSTSHQNVNVYGLPDKKFEIRSEDAAIDIQIHNL